MPPNSARMPSQGLKLTRSCLQTDTSYLSPKVLYLSHTPMAIVHMHARSEFRVIVVSASSSVKPLSRCWSDLTSYIFTKRLPELVEVCTVPKRSLCFYSTSSRSALRYHPGELCVEDSALWRVYAYEHVVRATSRANRRPIATLDLRHFSVQFLCHLGCWATASLFAVSCL